MPQNPGVWQPPNRTTIDATTPDLALDAARTAYPSGLDHSKVSQAVGNLLASEVAYGRVGQIIGHGMPGLIIVGNGRKRGAPQTYISLGNKSTWEPWLQTLAPHIQALRLVGCCVGAEQDGADLLRQVACVVRRPVIAPTGKARAVPHEKIMLQDGSVWQVGQCNVEAHVIPLPNEPDQPPAPLLLATPAGGRQAVPVDRVRRLDFVRSDWLATDSLHLEGDAARELIVKAELREPREERGYPLAVLTGELTITYLDEDGQERQRDFDLLAETMLQDKQAPEVIYDVSPAFRAALPRYELRRGE
jgi:hypothetical protein